MKNRAYVYVIEDQQERIKIGVATDVKSRASSIQTGNADTLVVQGIVPCSTREDAVNLEKDLHNHLTKYQIRGEWYSCSMLNVMLYLRTRNLHKKVTLLDELYESLKKEN
jgi:predicted GIY-YIG superfamily endonuclease